MNLALYSFSKRDVNSYTANDQWTRFYCRIQLRLYRVWMVENQRDCKREYALQVREAFNRKMQVWLEKSVLLLYFAVQAKGKCILWSTIECQIAMPTHLQPMQKQKLRDYQKKGFSISLIYLMAYLQVHVHKSLWPFQTVTFKGHCEYNDVTEWRPSKLGIG